MFNPTKGNLEVLKLRDSFHAATDKILADRDCYEFKMIQAIDKACFEEMPLAKFL